jgi:hypothetical protein
MQSVTVVLTPPEVASIEHALFMLLRGYKINHGAEIVVTELRQRLSTSLIMLGAQDEAYLSARESLYPPAS